MTYSYGWTPSTKRFPVKHRYSAIQIPQIIDLSKYRSEIINQLSDGCCTGCGTGGVISGHQAQLGQNPDKKFLVSPDASYNMGREMEGTLSQDVGAQPFDVLSMIQAHGYLPYADMPLKGTYNTIDPTDTSPYDTELVKLPNFIPHRIDTSNPDTALANILDAMAQIQVAGTGGTFINVGFMWPAEWESYQSGVLPVVQPSYNYVGGHDTYWYIANSIKRLITGANSWGVAWGENGTYVLSMDVVPILAKYGSLQAEYVTFDAPVPTPNPTPIPVPTPTPVPNKCNFWNLFQKAKQEKQNREG